MKYLTLVEEREDGNYEYIVPEHRIVYILIVPVNAEEDDYDMVILTDDARYDVLAYQQKTKEYCKGLLHGILDFFNKESFSICAPIKVRRYEFG